MSVWFSKILNKPTYLQHEIADDSGQMAECNLDYGCKCEDSKNNTYTCLRSLRLNSDLLFCQFADSVQQQEFYDLNQDPYQLHNKVSSQFLREDNLLSAYQNRLDHLLRCKGHSQCNSSLNTIFGG